MPADGPSSQTSPLRPLLQLFARLGGNGAEPERTAAATAAAEVAEAMVDQVEQFQTLTVEDVMTPRADIVALELSTPLGEVVRRFVEAEHSRIPVYRETLDDPVGLVHVKDVMKLIAPAANGETPDWSRPVLHRLRRDVLYVPASMRAADLMLKMQTTRSHLALVIDEFGGTDGLVTLEDLIESVVGEIEDEHDEVQAAEVVRRSDDLIEADARAALEDVEAEVGGSLSVEELEEEVDTVGGLVSAMAGRVPQRGEVVSHPAGWEIEVLDADPRRVKRVRLRRVERVELAEVAPADA
jgi:CBS domain containing-hemolysin-like protein